METIDLTIPPALRAKIKSRDQVKRRHEEKRCTLFTDYQPKPGGQTDFWNVIPFESITPIPYRVVWARGGIGAGKSHIGSAFACSRAFLDPTARGLITANTYGQLETSTLPALVEFCDQFNIPIEPRRATTEETAKAIAARRLVKIFNTSVLVLSAELFMGGTAGAKEAGRGLQIRWFWADEFAYSDKSAFETLLGRLGRGNGKMKGLGVITSSINRNNPYNFCYNYFDDPERDEAKRDLYRSINLLTSDNDSLDEDYIAGLEASYTKELAAIELRGEYARVMDGLLFSYFDRDKHLIGFELDPRLPLHIGFDFNRNPATCIIGQLEESERRLSLVEEFYQLNSDTFKLSEAVVSRVKGLRPPLVYLYGDTSGAAMTANSQLSNWAIVQNAFRAAGIAYNKRYPAKNPPIIDTVNSVNCLLQADRLTLNPRLKETIKDMEFMKDDGRGGIDKKTDPMRTHLGDIVRYLVHSIYPFEKPIAGSHGVRVPLKQLSARATYQPKATANRIGSRRQ